LFFLAVILSLASPAAAKEITVNDQDQIVILQVCDTASVNPNVPRDMRAGIVNWCVQWDGRVRKNNEEAASERKDTTGTGK
jgi:hypothetical protein